VTLIAPGCKVLSKPSKPSDGLSRYRPRLWTVLSKLVDGLGPKPSKPLDQAPRRHLKKQRETFLNATRAGIGEGRRDLLQTGRLARSERSEADESVAGKFRDTTPKNDRQKCCR